MTCEVSKHPPWSIEMSTSTAPGCIARDDARPSRGAAPWRPGSARRRPPDRPRARGARSRASSSSRSGSGPARSGRCRGGGRRCGPRRSPRPPCRRRSGPRSRRPSRRRARRRSPGATPEAPPISTPRPPTGALERRGAFLRSHPAGDLGHRREQRQPPVGELHGLVRHRADAPLGEEPGRGPVRRQVQVGEEQLPLAEPLVLRRLGLLHLHDQVGGREHGVGVGEDLARRPPRTPRRRSRSRSRRSPPRRRGGRRRRARAPPRGSRPPGTRGPSLPSGSRRSRVARLLDRWKGSLAQAY